jgi:hypothetical protein
MKRNILFLFVLLLSLGAKSQTITIVNKSGSPLYFQVSASDNGGCDQKYTSIAAVVNAAATVKYQSFSEIQWSAGVPQKGASFSGFNGMYMDASGGCIAKASNHIGETRCLLKREATINTGKCAPGSGDLHITWSSANDNVTVTIN